MLADTSTPRAVPRPPIFGAASMRHRPIDGCSLILRIERIEACVFLKLLG
jgi:hypothetical protein